MYHAIATPEFRAASRPSSVPAPGIGRLLVVAEEPEGRRALLSHLAASDCVALGCGAGDIGRHLQGQSLSLILVECRPGGLSGIDVLRQIRERSDVPVILYGNAHSAEVDRVLCLESGADDVLSGTLNLHELLARARAVLRRQELGRLGTRALRGGFRFNGWELRHATRALTSPIGKAVDLTKKEYALLVAFLESRGRPLSRLHLMRVTRSHEDIFDRSIDVQVLRLRRKLEVDPTGRDMIRTHRGKGYSLDACVEPVA